MSFPCKILVLFIALQINISNCGVIFKDAENKIRTKRFVYTGLFTSNDEYSTCVTSDNKPGLCRPVHHCIVREMRSNFWGITNSVCNSGGMFYGICCPENNTLTHEKIINLKPREDNEIEKANDEICGTGKQSKPKIVGGMPASPKSYPWMVALMEYGSNQFCGGVLISKKHVLSAAHCTFNMKTYEVRVRLGEYDFTRRDDSNSQDYRVVKILQHPQYDDSNLKNDISILTLNRIVNFDGFIKPICLPSVEDDYVNKTTTVIGWGSLGFGDPFSNVLMEVDIQVWPKDSCEKALSMSVSNSSLCAGSYNERKDSCQGDSGGPLMMKLQSGRWITIGIVSGGLACGKIGQPAIYTKVDQYLSWINENTPL